MKRILSQESKTVYLRGLLSTAVSEAKKWHHLIMSLRKDKNPQPVDASLIAKGRTRREHFLREANMIKDLMDELRLTDTRTGERV